LMVTWSNSRTVVEQLSDYKTIRPIRQLDEGGG
jgi:hypothetical protein